MLMQTLGPLEPISPMCFFSPRPRLLAYSWIVKSFCLEYFHSFPNKIMNLSLAFVEL